MTASTHIHSITQRHLLAMPTLAAILTCVGWIYFDKHSSSFFRFARELGKESRPRRVCNTLSETMIVHHSIDVQIFDKDRTKPIHNLSRLLMDEICALEID